MQVGRTETVTQIDGNRLDTSNQKARFMVIKWALDLLANLKFYKFGSILYALKNCLG